MISDEEKQELYTDGFADSVKRGIEKNRIQTVLAMLKDGMPAETVSKYTGLSVEELSKL